MRLFGSSYTELERTLTSANGESKRETASVVVWAERLDDDVWARTSLFRTSFRKFFLDELTTPSSKWREDTTLCECVNREFVRSVVPNCRDDSTYAAIENVAFAYFCYKVAAEDAARDLGEPLPKHFLQELPYGGTASELAPSAETIISAKIAEGFEGVLADALELARKYARAILNR